ncbi:MAG: hypothetical protein OJF62_000551 [Pseudolabrys sp.]|jgi:uncharacterized protein YecT (DUF1311 family)|nr:hypothetical protein [Pseudolabrys sp.]
MIVRIAMAAAALLGAAVSAHAGAQGDPGDTCGVSTPEIVACLNKQAEHWDRELNAAYQAALKDAAPRQREQLRTAQRLWIQYRDANCMYYALGEGTIALINAASCTLEMTKARANELKGGGAGPDNRGNEDRD